MDYFEWGRLYRTYAFHDWNIHGTVFTPADCLWYQEWWLGSIELPRRGNMNVIELYPVFNYRQAVLDGVSLPDHRVQGMQVYDEL